MAQTSQPLLVVAGPGGVTAGSTPSHKLWSGGSVRSWWPLRPARRIGRGSLMSGCARQCGWAYYIDQV